MRKYQTIPKEKKAEIISAYLTGDNSYEELAEYYKVNPSTIRGWISRYRKRKNVVSLQACQPFQEKDNLFSKGVNESSKVSTCSVKRLSTTSGKKTKTVNQNQEKTKTDLSKSNTNEAFGSLRSEDNLYLITISEGEIIAKKLMIIHKRIDDNDYELFSIGEVMKYGLSTNLLMVLVR